jgi:hypothetical protein
MSFLDKFKKWELDKQNNVLILYKWQWKKYWNSSKAEFKNSMQSIN